MARRRDAEPPSVIEGRPFTPAEHARIRQIIAASSSTRDHPRPGVAELERIHAAAGRTRMFKGWELDAVRSLEDFDRAYAEEVSDDD